MSWYVEAFAIFLGVACGNIATDTYKIRRSERAMRKRVDAILAEMRDKLPAAKVVPLRAVFDRDEDAE